MANTRKPIPTTTSRLCLWETRSAVPRGIGESTLLGPKRKGLFFIGLKVHHFPLDLYQFIFYSIYSLQMVCLQVFEYRLIIHSSQIALHGLHCLPEPPGGRDLKSLGQGNDQRNLTPQSQTATAKRAVKRSSGDHAPAVKRGPAGRV